MTHPEATRYLTFSEEMKSPDGTRSLLVSTLDAYDTEAPLFVLAAEDTASRAYVGCCGVNPLDARSAEIFYSVMPALWGQGFATEMTRTLTTYLFAQAGVAEVKAFIAPKHEASKRVAVKVGFLDTGLVKNANFAGKVHQYVLTRERMVKGEGSMMDREPPS
jgi:RimJ/RimL family protein N-acetyltransferase